MSPAHTSRHRAPTPHLLEAGRRVNPLRDFAFIADGNRGALIGPSGDVAWMCFPTWSDPALFADLLGSGGVFRISPAEAFVIGGYYEDRSLIWRSRWVTRHGMFESRDALAYPGSPDQAVLLRRVFALEGATEMAIEFAPSSDYGRRPFTRWRREDGVFVAHDGPVTVRLRVPECAEISRRTENSGGIELRLKLVPGEHHDFVAEFTHGERPSGALPDPDECWRTTESTWQSVVPDCSHVIAGGDVARSIAVLRAMTDANGATVAAATTSLPERDDADRNYDYRFCWIRDTCYVGHAGAALDGGESILDDAVRWVGERLRADGDRTSPAYLGNGEPIYAPKKLDVAGYPGGADVVGNRVREQFQLDLFGEALLLFARAASCDRLDLDGWRAATIAIDAIEKRWNEPEAGIWEIEPRRWTHSRLVCVAGLRAISASGAPDDRSTRSLALADHILDCTNATSLHPSGRWQRAPDDDRLDAALLLAEVRGALSPTDSRSALTRDAIASELAKDHFLYRYRTEGHDLGEDEGAFLICNFWMALALSGAGDATESARWFERGRSAMGTTGLFSEEFDTGEHQLRGNLPQAFVHATLVEAAAAQGPC